MSADDEIYSRCAKYSSCLILDTLLELNTDMLFIYLIKSWMKAIRLILANWLFGCMYFGTKVVSWLELYRYGNCAKEKALSCELIPKNKYGEEGTPLPKTCNLCANSRILHMVDKIKFISFSSRIEHNFWTACARIHCSMLKLSIIGLWTWPMLGISCRTQCTMGAYQIND